VACDIEVDRRDLTATRVVERPLPELAAGEVLLRVDRFALTANNVTYALLGDGLRYWTFFPADDGWGRLPVWGLADVTASNQPGVEPGQRFYGYYPMGSHLIVRAGRVAEHGFVDTSPHRAALSRTYNSYRRVDNDPDWDPRRDDEQVLLRPLFLTSYLIDEFLAGHDWFGADAVVLSSASSKTALGTAKLLADRGGHPVFGLTSPANLAFTTSLRVYDAVAPYGDLDALPDTAVAYVDVSGDQRVRAAVHDRFGDGVRYSGAVGATHWNTAEFGGTPFFAPDQVRDLIQRWGIAGFEARSGAALRHLVDFAAGWLTVERRHGADAVRDAYTRLVAGQVNPSTGLVLGLAR